MYVLLILLIIIIVVGTTTTGGDGKLIKPKLPFYTIMHQNPCTSTYVFPTYCTPGSLSKPSFDLPDYHVELKNLIGPLYRQAYMYNRTKFNMTISNEYGNVFMSLRYLHELFKWFRADVILVDGHHGILANLIAKIFDVRVHYFSNKRHMALDRRVKWYGRLPRAKDLAQLSGQIVLSYALFTGGSMINPNDGFNRKRTQNEFQNWLCMTARPRAFYILYSGSKMTYKIMEGRIMAVPFYYPESFFCVQSEFRDVNTIRGCMVDGVDLCVRVLIHMFCQRPMIFKIGGKSFTYDTWYAYETMQLIGPKNGQLITDVLGPVPCIATTTDMTCQVIVADVNNTQYYSPQEHVDIDRSVFIADFHKWMPQLGMQYQIVWMAPLRVFQRTFNVIYEPRMALMMRVWEHMMNDGHRIVFVDNITYFREFMLQAMHLFTTEPPTAVRRIIDLVSYPKYKILTETEVFEYVKQNNMEIIPSDFQTPIIKKYLVKLLRGLLPRKLRKIRDMWIDPSWIMIECMHEIYPNMHFHVLGALPYKYKWITYHDEIEYLSANDHDQKNEWYFNCA